METNFNSKQEIEEAYTPRTINPSEASCLELSCTELTNFSSDDETETYTENESTNDEIQVQVTKDSLIIRKAVTRDEFWSLIDRYGSIDNFPSIHWAYSAWDDQIPADLEFLRNTLAHFNLYDPWPDIFQILNSDQEYPNIVTIRCVNLCQVLTPLTYSNFISKFPNLRQISFSKPTAMATLSLRKLVALTKNQTTKIYLELLE